MVLLRILAANFYVIIKHMQYPVPQFTDVEDKIIGPLTLKQIGIVFGAGVIVFLGYSASGKNIVVLIVLALIFGIPALAVAFVKYNGRPIYNMFGRIFSFITSDKQLIFHKEIYTLNSQTKLKNAEIAVTSKESDEEEKKDPQARLKEVREMLQKKDAEERELVGKIK